MAFAADMLHKCKQHFLHGEQTEDHIINVEQTAAGGNDNLYQWPHEAILLLIKEYRKMSDNLHSGKLSQKKIWLSISNELVKKYYPVTGPRCQSKFAGLKRTYKSIKDHNNKSGNAIRIWPYFEIMDGKNGKFIGCLDMTIQKKREGVKLVNGLRRIQVVQSRRSGPQKPNGRGGTALRL